MMCLLWDRDLCFDARDLHFERRDLCLRLWEWDFFFFLWCPWWDLWWRDSSPSGSEEDGGDGRGITERGGGTLLFEGGGLTWCGKGVGAGETQGILEVGDVFGGGDWNEV